MEDGQPSDNGGRDGRSMSSVMQRTFAGAVGVVSLAASISGLAGLIANSRSSTIAITVGALAAIGLVVTLGAALWVFGERKVPVSAVAVIALLFLIIGAGIDHIALRPAAVASSCPCPSSSPVASASTITNPSSAGPPPTTPEATLTNPGSQGVSSVVYSPDGGLLASGDINGAAYLWAAGTTTSPAKLAVPSHQQIFGIAFSSDGTELAAGTSNSSYNAGSIVLWNVASGKVVTTLVDPGGRGVGGGVAISPDGALLAAADANNITYVWNLATGKLARKLDDATGQDTFGVAFSPAGDTLAVADGDGHAYLWNAATGERMNALAGTAKVVMHAVAFTPDGKTLVGADDGGRVYLWDVASGRLITRLDGPSTQAANSVAISRAGDLIAAAFISSGQHKESSILVWDLSSRKLVATFHDPGTGGAFRVTFSADGRTLAVGDGNANAYLWDLSWLQ